LQWLISNYFHLFFRSALSPTIVSSGTDTPTLMNDYKSDMDIDMHKPMNSLDTDYRPNYEGRINTINSNVIIFHTNLYFRFTT